MDNPRFRFRAWDKDKKEILNNWQNSIWIEYQGFDGGDAFEIMQYTGLKDKNGKEIYEGDIIQHTGFAGHIKSVIEWNDSRMGWTYFHPRKEFIVVGNIYENSELLEEKE